MISTSSGPDWKKDIWLPRSGHRVNLKVNSRAVAVEMILDSEGRAYFPTNPSKPSRFWAALVGSGDGEEENGTTTATAAQLGEFGLRPGVNKITFSVETVSGAEVTTASYIHLLNNNARIVVSDIDGTITK